MSQIKLHEIETMEKLIAVSKEYDVFDDRCYEVILDNLPKNKLIVELGCGTGAMTFRICNKASSVVGIDISKSALNIAKEKRCGRKNIHLICADIENLPIKSFTFEMAFCGAILHHFQYHNRVIKEIKRVLKEDGMIFAFEPNGLNPWIKLRFTMNKRQGILSPNETTIDLRYLKRILEIFGFKNSKVILFDPVMNISAAKVYTRQETKLNDILCFFRTFILFIIGLIPLLRSWFIIICKKKLK